MQRRAEYIVKHGEPSPAEQQMQQELAQRNGTSLLASAPERLEKGIDERKVK